jgi:protein dithiol:quinone oxidoreductase
MALNRIGLLWLLIGTAGIGIGLASVALTEWLHLDPCHLCIFQRLLMLMIGIFAPAAAWMVWRRSSPLIPGMLTLITALAGVAVATHQSWLQSHPSASNSCVSSTPGLIESFVEWLGQQMPSLFLATGFCADEGFQIFGLTLANASLLLFVALTAAALLALSRSFQASSR